MTALRNRCFALIFLLGALVLLTPNGSKNSCADYFSYFFINFSNKCYKNPDIGDAVCNIIRRHLGICETHQVQTEDGYFLTLFHIPRNNSKGTIFFQQAFLYDAKMWISQNKHSVAFLFWKAGYDVWLGNVRGSSYSRRQHESLSPSEPQFWNFSLHEMGYYDQHASIEYIKQQTKRNKIVYFGYSMSGALGLIYSSTRPQQAANSLQTMILMAPCTNFRHAKGLLEYIIPLLLYVFRDGNVGVYSLGHYDSWMLRSFRYFHNLFPFKKYFTFLCSISLGWAPDELDPNLVTLIVNQFGSAMSVNSFEHFYQIYKNGGNFQAFDYGERGNLEKYGTLQPLQYDMKKIEVPVFLIYSFNDALSHHKDNELLFDSLSEGAKSHRKLAVTGLSHLDFAFGRNRIEKIYAKILMLLTNVSHH